MLFRYGILVLAVATALMLDGCVPGQPSPSDTQIVTRVRSPGGSLEAVYAEDMGGGAAVGATEEVFVVPPGTFPHLRERIFAEECVHGIALKWQGPRAIEIDYTISSDAHEHSKPYEPSPFSPISLLSGGYWTSRDPHGVRVRFVRRLTLADGGC